jgi:uncharacterized protein YggE
MVRSMRKLVMPLIAILSLSVVLTGCAGTSSSQPISAGYLPSDTISVSGYGEAIGKPDMAEVQLGISVSNEDIGEAVDESDQVIRKVKEALLQLGMVEEDIQTTNFNVWPEDRYDPVTGVSTGERTFHVDSTLQVKVRQIGTISEVIEAGLDAGANNIYGLTFGIDDTSELEAEARVKAIEDARSRASQVAEQVGVQLGDPIIVSELAAGASQTYAGYETAAMGGGGPSISPGQLTVTMQIDVTFSFTR